MQVVRHVDVWVPLTRCDDSTVEVRLRVFETLTYDIILAGEQDAAAQTPDGYATLRELTPHLAHEYAAYLTELRIRRRGLMPDASEIKIEIAGMRDIEAKRVLFIEHTPALFKTEGCPLTRVDFLWERVGPRLWPVSEIGRTGMSLVELETLLYKDVLLDKRPREGAERQCQAERRAA